MLNEFFKLLEFGQTTKPYWEPQYLNPEISTRIDNTARIIRVEQDLIF